jgi:hypothetical protein
MPVEVVTAVKVELTGPGPTPVVLGPAPVVASPDPQAASATKNEKVML